MVAVVELLLNLIQRDNGMHNMLCRTKKQKGHAIFFTRYTLQQQHLDN
jgi:hypothetical protein